MNPDHLADSLGHAFRDPTLLSQALTHRSYGTPNNERLEFLGDAVLDCVVGDLLFHAFPQIPEGALSRLRANLVNQQALFELASGLDLGGHLRLGEGELKSGGAARPSILADALESLIAAVYLDAGFDAAHGVVGRLFEERIRAIDPRSLGKDAKTCLQELLQARRQELPEYRLIRTEGEAHAQTFHVECLVAARNLRTTGVGASRKAAEQDAAAKALDEMTEGT